MYGPGRATTYKPYCVRHVCEKALEAAKLELSVLFRFVDKPGNINIRDVEAVFAHALEGCRPFRLRNPEIVDRSADQDIDILARDGRRSWRSQRILLRTLNVLDWAERGWRQDNSNVRSVVHADFFT